MTTVSLVTLQLSMRTMRMVISLWCSVVGVVVVGSFSVCCLALSPFLPPPCPLPSSPSVLPQVVKVGKGASTTLVVKERKRQRIRRLSSFFSSSIFLWEGTKRNPSLGSIQRETEVESRRLGGRLWLGGSNGQNETLAKIRMWNIGMA